MLSAVKVRASLQPLFLLACELSQVLTWGICLQWFCLLGGCPPFHFLPGSGLPGPCPLPKTKESHRVFIFPVKLNSWPGFYESRFHFKTLSSSCGMNRIFLGKVYWTKKGSGFSSQKATVVIGCFSEKSNQFSGGGWIGG